MYVFALSAQSQAREFISVFADHRLGSIVVTVTSSRSNTALRYYDPGKIPAELQDLYTGKTLGWEEVHLLDGEDRRWEMGVLEQLSREGWRLDQQAFAIGMGSVITETYTQLEREIRNTYLLSRPASSSVASDTLFMARGDVTGDDIDETFIVVADPTLKNLGGELLRSLIVNFSDGREPLLTSAPIPATYLQDELPDPLREMTVIDSQFVMTMQPPGLTQLNTYYFSCDEKGLFLNLVDIKGQVKLNKSLYKMNFVYRLTDAYLGGSATLIAYDDEARTAQPVKIGESTKRYATLYLQQFSPGAQYVASKRLWKGKVIY